MSKSHAATDSNQFTILTDPGPAAIAVVRVCGPQVEAFLREGLRPLNSTGSMTCQPGRVVRAQLLDRREPLDDILVSCHRAGPCWDIRLHLHGGRGIVQRCAEMLVERGFVESSDSSPSLWNSENKIEAEAFALLPKMATLAGTRWLSAQAGELPTALKRLHDKCDIQIARRECRALLQAPPIFDWFASPLRVALVGPPNSGKSSLVNALSEQRASLVSPVAGTTRDWLEIRAEMCGFPVVWLDTAGVRRSADALETASIALTHEVMSSADAVLFVLDGSSDARDAQREFIETYAHDRPTCAAINKADRMTVADVKTGIAEDAACWRVPITIVSATEGTGVDALMRSLLQSLGRDRVVAEEVSPFTARQRDLLHEAVNSGRERFRSLLDECVGAD